MILDIIPVFLFVVILVLLFLMRKQLASIEVNQDGQDKVNSLREEISRSEQRIKDEVRSSQRTISETLTTQLQSTGEMLGTTLTELGKAQTRELENVTKSTNNLTQSNENRIENVRKTVDDRIQALQISNENSLDQIRQTLTEELTVAGDALVSTVSRLADMQRQRLEDLTKSTKNLMQSNEASIESIRRTVDNRLQIMQDSNERKLDQMRKTVDDQLQSTLEKRLTESFTLVTEHLESVQRGLGAMQNLAAGVGNLQRVLTNVSTRGTWGEVQLGAILEEILTPDQYDRNVQPHMGSERVEYAIRLPGQNGDPTSHIWLPIDAKFPIEDYQRLMDAAEKADKEAEQTATRSLRRTVRTEARSISKKYIAVPYTTDFAIMFLPTEGLYAEILRQPGLVEQLRRDYSIIVAGPTTLSAILSSLRLGFQTLAIQEHSSEIRDVLGAVKTECEKFGGIMERLKKQLNTASNTVESTGARTRAMARHLRDVEQLPQEVASERLGFTNIKLVEDISE